MLTFDKKESLTKKFISLRKPNTEPLMARPIKETPVLKGKDAKNFAKKIANPSRISAKERKDAEKVYNDFKGISKFEF